MEISYQNDDKLFLVLTDLADSHRVDFRVNVLITDKICSTWFDLMNLRTEKECYQNHSQNFQLRERSFSGKFSSYAHIVGRDVIYYATNELVISHKVSRTLII